MNLPADDLDRFADERLDELIGDAAWTALEARHGNALAIALQQARERRAAVAALPRPALSETQRARLLPPAPAPLRFPWRVAATVAIAACLVILVLPRMSLSDPAPSGPDLAHESQTRESPARQSQAEADAGALARGPTVAPVAAPAVTPTPLIAADEQVLAELAETARTNAGDGLFPADVLLAEAPGPHALALAWAPPRTAAVADDAAGVRRSEPVLRQRSPQGAAATESGQPAAASAFVAPAEAPATATEPMVVVLHNRTVSPWVVAADQLRIEARNAVGTVLWEGRVDAIGTLTVAPGGFLSLTVDRSDWPATTHSLRAVLDHLVSADLSLDPPAPK